MEKGENSKELNIKHEKIKILILEDRMLKLHRFYSYIGGWYIPQRENTEYWRILSLSSYNRNCDRCSQFY